jgi:hypothetical protein
MVRRPLDRRWVIRVALTAALLPLLAECGPARNQFAPACPGRVFLGDAADLDIYRPSNAPGGGHDLTELILQGRVVGLSGSCQAGDRKAQLAVAISPSFELTRGPAMAGRQIDVPVFIAVVDGGTVIDKRVYAMRAAFPPNVDTVTLTPGEIDLVLPVSPTKTGASYTILIGFQLTPDQAARNRQNRGQ